MSKGEEQEFRLRPRKPPTARGAGERVALARAFKTIAHFSRASRAMKSRGSAGKGARRAPITRNQRCAIRVTYVRDAVRGQWRAHGRYLARESAANERATAGFDHANQGIDISTRLQSWQSARDDRLWKIIISPE